MLSRHSNPGIFAILDVHMFFSQLQAVPRTHWLDFSSFDDNRDLRHAAAASPPGLGHRLCCSCFCVCFCKGGAALRTRTLVRANALRAREVCPALGAIPNATRARTKSQS